MNLESTNLPPVRVRVCNQDQVNADGKYVLYWMIAARRTKHNFALERAVEWAQQLKRPLVIFEPLRAGYQWNCDRIHAFAIQGMADNARDFSKKNVVYFPYLEKKHGDAKGLLKALANESCLVITDDFPCFFLPNMIEAAAKKIKVRLEAIDGNGMFPMRATERVFARAYDFRRFLQKNLLPHLAEVPSEDPLKGKRLAKAESKLIAKITKKWPAADPKAIVGDLDLLSDFSIDHSVTPSPTIIGGSRAANERLDLFINKNMKRYNERNQPENPVSSGLSPYLHFGHVGSHEIFASVIEKVKWNPKKVSSKANGSSTGWWGTTEAVESFLDELITWREIGYNFTALRDDYDQYSSLPDWARQTLKEHAKDKREYLYSDEEFETAQTHDELWNAAQWQLVTTGIMHNYLRMLWGKKILEWSKSPKHALATMIHLNNKYALDGRNPNSYSGIFWVLGRYDRAWGPERPIFGKIRYMSSENTARKLKVKNYIQQYSPHGQQVLFE